MRFILPIGLLRSIAIVAVIAAIPSAAFAHGFGQRFDLPLPLWLWEIGAGATIVGTFVLVGIFMRQSVAPARFPRLVLMESSQRRPLLHGLVIVLRGLVAFVFVLSLLAGFFGSQDPYRNLLPTMVWVQWWVGFAFVGALIGDLWSVVNPLRTLAELAARLAERIAPAVAMGSRLTYPRALAAWPGVVLFVGFAWCELVWQGKDIPLLLATVVLVYAVITWAGMLAYGPRTWLKHGDAFSIAFAVLGRFAPLGSMRGAIGEPPDGSLELRPYGAALLTDEPVHWSLLVFVLAMLATVTFDGFQETSLMQWIDTGLQQQHSLALLLFQLSEWGIEESAIVHTVLLVAFPLLFLVAFWLTSLATVLLVRRYAPDASVGTIGASASAVAREFVLTLVPIAVAYHLSHYFSLWLTAGQFIVPLGSDPFGFGWNLFGTAQYAVNLGIVSPYFFWYSAVVMIVAGHIIAVLLAHNAALRVFRGRRAALVSQIPMVVLMVAYTSLSLWILAQPILS